MLLDKQDLIYGAVAGGIIGIVYRLVSAHWQTPAETILASDLLAAAAIGAAAGILAFVVRRNVG